MEIQPSGTLVTPKVSAISRPSRLPVMRPSSSLDIRLTSPSHEQASISQAVEQRTVKPSAGRQSLHATIRGRPSFMQPPTPRLPASSTKPTTQTTQITKASRPSLSVSTIGRDRRISYGMAQTRSRQAAPTKQHEQASGQENEIMDEDRLIQDEEVLDIATLSLASPAPSLTDRTLESLSQVPTPNTARRRSSFFNPHTPIPSSRPATVLGSCPVSKLNYGSVRRTALPRPTSPMKPSPVVPSASATMRPPARRIMTEVASKTTAPPARMTPSLKMPIRAANPASRPASAASISRRASYVPSIAPKQKERPALSLHIAEPRVVNNRPRSSLAGLKQSQLTHPRPTEPVTRKTVTQVKPTSKRQAATSSTASVPTKLVSSAALRAQIAQAKAAQKTTLKSSPVARSNPLQFQELGSNSSSPSDVTTMARRIDTARRDGKLNISGMGLKRIPDEVMQMYSPKSMEGSSISWFEAVQVSRLVVADNELEAIQDEVFPDTEVDTSDEDALPHVFGALESLDMHGNLLITLPPGLGRLAMLTSLNLSRNKLDNTVLDIICKVKSLRSLNLSSNELSKELPECVGELENLENLDLAHNKLVLLPGTLPRLNQLRTLNLSGNRLSDLYSDLLVQLPNLTELYASGNALTGALFPSTVESLPNLQTLDVSNNSIASLSFSGALILPSLTHLNICRNRLHSLPDLTVWSSLTNLLAEDNSLTTLPPGFTSLTQVRKVDLKANSFRKIDFAIANMAGLEVLNLQGNPMIERKWTTMGWESLRAELLTRLDDGALIEQAWENSTVKEVDNVNGVLVGADIEASATVDTAPAQDGHADDETF